MTAISKFNLCLTKFLWNIKKITFWTGHLCYIVKFLVEGSKVIFINLGTFIVFYSFPPWLRKLPFLLSHPRQGSSVCSNNSYLLYVAWLSGFFKINFKESFTVGVDSLASITSIILQVKWSYDQITPRTVTNNLKIKSVFIVYL